MGGASCSVQTGCIANGQLAAYKGTGPELTIGIDTEIYAGIIEYSSGAASSLVRTNAFISTIIPPVETSDSKQILTGSPQTNSTTISVDPFSLSPPVNDATVAAGCFTMSVPPYVSGTDLGGCAAVKQQSQVILTNFVELSPNTSLLIQPKQVQHIAQGNYTVRETIPNYATLTSTAAKCDFTTGATGYSFSLKADGTFDVDPPPKVIGFTHKRSD